MCVNDSIESCGNLASRKLIEGDAFVRSQTTGNYLLFSNRTLLNLVIVLALRTLFGKAYKTICRFGSK